MIFIERPPSSPSGELDAGGVCANGRIRAARRIRNGRRGPLPGAKVIRDIRRINGRAPRERDKKARAGCTDPNPLSPEPLAFLLPAHRDEYRFTSVRDGKEKGRAALVIDFMSANRDEQARAHRRRARARRLLRLVGSARDERTRLGGPEHARRAARRPASRRPRGRPRARDAAAPIRFRPWVVLERDDLTMRYKAVAFSDPDEVIRLPESIESMTVLRGGLQSMRRTETFSDYRRFLATGRVTIRRSH